MLAPAARRSLNSWAKPTEELGCCVGLGSIAVGASCGGGSALAELAGLCADAGAAASTQRIRPTITLSLAGISPSRICRATYRSRAAKARSGGAVAPREHARPRRRPSPAVGQEPKTGSVRPFLQPELAHLAIERGAADSEALCHLRPVGPIAPARH